MDNLNREQAVLLCELNSAFDKDTLTVRKCRVTKMTKRVPTPEELEQVRHLPEFANYVTTVLDSNYGTWNAFSNQYWPNKYLIDIPRKFACYT